MGRKEARDGAFKMLYQLDINSNDPIQAMEDFFKEYNYTKGDKEYIREVVTGVIAKKEDINLLVDILFWYRVSICSLAHRSFHIWHSTLLVRLLHFRHNML